MSSTVKNKYVRVVMRITKPGFDSDTEEIRIVPSETKEFKELKLEETYVTDKIGRDLFHLEISLPVNAVRWYKLLVVRVQGWEIVHVEECVRELRLGTSHVVLEMDYNDPDVRRRVMTSPLTQGDGPYNIAVRIPEFTKFKPKPVGRNTNEHTEAECNADWRMSCRPHSSPKSKLSDSKDTTFNKKVGANAKVGQTSKDVGKAESKENIIENGDVRPVDVKNTSKKQVDNGTVVARPRSAKPGEVLEVFFFLLAFTLLYTVMPDPAIKDAVKMLTVNSNIYATILKARNTTCESRSKKSNAQPEPIIKPKARDTSAVEPEQNTELKVQPEIVEKSRVTNERKVQPEVIEKSSGTNERKVKPEIVEKSRVTNERKVQPEVIEKSCGTNERKVHPEIIEKSRVTNECKVQPEIIEKSRVTNECEVQPDVIEKSSGTNATDELVNADIKCTNAYRDENCESNDDQVMVPVLDKSLGPKHCPCDRLLYFTYAGDCGKVKHPQTTKLLEHSCETHKTDRNKNMPKTMCETTNLVGKSKDVEQPAGRQNKHQGDSMCVAKEWLKFAVSIGIVGGVVAALGTYIYCKP